MVSRSRKADMKREDTGDTKDTSDRPVDDIPGKGSMADRIREERRRRQERLDQIKKEIRGQ